MAKWATVVLDECARPLTNAAVSLPAIHFTIATSPTPPRSILVASMLLRRELLGDLIFVKSCVEVFIGLVNDKLHAIVERGNRPDFQTEGIL